MEKKIYYIHPATEERGLIYVTKILKDAKGNERLDSAFLIDLPGHWDDEKYNLHVDGCDYLCDTLNDALKQGADVLDYDPLAPWSGNKPGYEFKKVFIPYRYPLTTPKYYGVDHAVPYVI